MNITIRPETPSDHRAVEELTREAFWNKYVPGCDEHLLIHTLRKAEAFTPSLNFVAIHNETIIGHIVYAEAKIIDGNTEHIILTFGPLSVLPNYQNRGVGGKLIQHTIPLAKEMNYKAILIYGDPDYYKRFGFVTSNEFNITNKEGKFPEALLVLELVNGTLDGIKGKFDEGVAYQIDKNELIEFEKKFEPKEKLITKSQERFLELSTMYLT